MAEKAVQRKTPRIIKTARAHQSRAATARKKKQREMSIKINATWKKTSSQGARCHDAPASIRSIHTHTNTHTEYIMLIKWKEEKKKWREEAKK